MDKNTNLILDRAVEMYCKGEDWKAYVNEEAKKRQYLKNQISEMFRKWVSLGNENSDD
jgi:hypothetical protein